MHGKDYANEAVTHPNTELVAIWDEHATRGRTNGVGHDPRDCCSTLVLSIAGVHANGAFELLWGSILAMREQDVWMMAGIAAAVVGVAVVFRRDLTLLLYDREIARSSGVPIGMVTTIVMGVIALAIGAAVRQTGALLVDAITILPALAARNLAQSQRGMIAWAVGIGLVGNLGGFILTLVINQPPGPVLVVTVSIITLLTYLKRC